MFDESIAFLKEQLNYHVKRSKYHYRALWVISVLIFLIVILYGGYVIELLKDVVNAHLYIQSCKECLPSSKNETPDLVKLINDNYFGYAAISGFIITMFGLVGLLRFHLKRASQLEKEIKELNFFNATTKYSKTNEADSTLSFMYEKVIGVEASESPQLHVLDLINESLQKIYKVVSRNGEK